MNSLQQSIARYKDRFSALAPREQWLVIAAAIAVMAAVFFLAVWEPLVKSHAQRESAIASAKELSAKLDRAALAVRAQAQSGGPSAALRSTSLITAIDQSSKQGGLGAGPARVQPQGDKEVRVWFEAVSFDALVQWTADLQNRYGISVQSMDIEPTSEPGQVNVRMTLERSV